MSAGAGIAAGNLFYCALGFRRSYELGYSHTLLPSTVLGSLLGSKILDTGVHPASLKPASL